MTSLYSHDVILLFYFSGLSIRIIRKKRSMETGASLRTTAKGQDHTRCTSLVTTSRLFWPSFVLICDNDRFLLFRLRGLSTLPGETTMSSFFFFFFFSFPSRKASDQEPTLLAATHQAV